MIADLEVKSRNANIKAKEVQETTNACEAQAAQIEIDKASANKDLEEAMPALRAAQTAVESLSAADINELKANNKPHIIIKYILDVVGIYFHNKLAPSIKMTAYQFSKKDPNEYPIFVESWEECGMVVKSNPALLTNLKTFAKDDINEETIELLTPYFDREQFWFNHDIAKNASNAGAGLLAWAKAIFIYYEKSKIVKPKRLMLE